MEVDEEPTAGPSTLPSRIHQQTSLQIGVSEQVSQYTCKRLASIVFHDDSNDDIRRALHPVYAFVHGLQLEDQQLHERLASRVEYQNNVKHFGEDKFIELLRNTAEKKDWKRLFQHGTLCLYLTRAH